MEIEENIPLASFTTFHIGGPARFFTRIKNAEELTQALAHATQHGLRVLVLGGGSNILISDAGFDGLVVKIEIEGIELQKEGDKTLLISGAGESWDGLVQKAVAENLWGVENLSGIPGTAGGAVAGNIGAYGQALSQTLAWAEVLDTKSGKVKKMTNVQCRFDYRKSFFSSYAKPSAQGEMNGSPTPSAESFAPLVILRAAFELSDTPAPELSYKDMKERFNDSSGDIGKIREAILNIRKGKFPDLALEGTAGSFFKNPIVSAAEAHELQKQYPGIPVFEMPETAGIKIPLAWILDKVLNLRGLRVGGARLFEKQPLVIVAEKNCASDDVQKLAEEVERRVKEKTGIKIEREVKIL
jgi:UDP-N-acetylmuramate dehydrogenase